MLFSRVVTYEELKGLVMTSILTAILFERCHCCFGGGGLGNIISRFLLLYGNQTSLLPCFKGV
jgi:hypothetical protein